MLAKKCQKKVLPAGCDGNTNVVWKNNLDYCNKCKSTYYTFEGKCYTKTTLTGCDVQDYNDQLKEHCTSCKTDYLLDTGKCYQKLTGCETNTVNN